MCLVSARLGSARLGSARLFSALLVIALSVSCGGDREGNDGDAARSSVAACEQLREHLIDVRLDGASGLDAAALAGQRAALQTGLGTEFIASCQQTMTRAAVQCARAARDGAGLARCDAAGAN